MLRGAGARRGKRERSGLRFSERDELVDRADPERRRNGQHPVIAHDASDRREIAEGIERRAAGHHEAVHDAVAAAAADDQGVAVGRRPGHRLGRDRAARAGAVLDDDRLTEVVRHPLRNRAADEVRRAAGREADDDLHRPDEDTARAAGSAIARPASAAPIVRKQALMVAPPGPSPARAQCRIGAGRRSRRPAASQS